MYYKCTIIQVEPGFEVVPQFVINDLQFVFSVDALESSHPISVQVNDPNEINEVFDSILTIRVKREKDNLCRNLFF